MSVAPPKLSLDAVLDQVAKEKGIEKPVLIETLEDAMLTAAKKHFGMDRQMEAKYEAEKGVVELFQAMVVVEALDPMPGVAVNQLAVAHARTKGMEVEPGDELVFQIFYRDEDAADAKAQDEQYGDVLSLKTFRRSFGRIAAQTAKQVLLARTRDVERENVFNAYKDRKNEVITGTARRMERRNLIVDLGNAEAVLPEREQIPREVFRPGDRVQAYVIDVLRESRGPQVVLSRASVNFLAKLFEMEVPEIAEGIVTIEAAAREPGSRAKIAVSTRDGDVDPVGACVGMKGSRVQAVVQELRGEKVDIVPWDDEPARFVCEALKPAEVSRVIIDESNHAMEIIVPDDQLSLAIGRRGQNVKLASQLTGWKLDINSESDVKQMREFASVSLGSLPGMNEVLIETLYGHGFREARQIAEAPVEVLEQIPGLDAAKIPAMQEAARLRMPTDSEMKMQMQQEKHEAKIMDERRHPDELTPVERFARVRGLSVRLIEQVMAAGYEKVEDVANETDFAKLGNVPGVGIKKARQMKAAAEQYLKEETDKRARLDAERAAAGLPVPAPSAETTASAEQHAS